MDTLPPEGLTSALEDYLETVYQFVRDRKFARVKDIARTRGVRAASVTPAMRRLADLGLVTYIEREYIALTPEGETQARRIYARHQLLTQLFADILGMEPEQAQADACAMEHTLSPSGVDHLARFLEFLQICPEGRGLLDKFHKCSAVQTDVPPCPTPCDLLHRKRGRGAPPQTVTLAHLGVGMRGSVVQVNGALALRSKLLDAGLVPGAVVQVERAEPGAESIQVSLEGFLLMLQREDAQLVTVAPQ